MKTITRKLILLAFVSALIGLSGCNTFKGLGRDVESLGRGIQNVGEPDHETY